jgi:hypothetical protein
MDNHYKVARFVSSDITDETARGKGKSVVPVITLEDVDGNERQRKVKVWHSKVSQWAIKDPATLAILVDKTRPSFKVVLDGRTQWSVRTILSIRFPSTWPQGYPSGGKLLAMIFYLNEVDCFGISRSEDGREIQHYKKPSNRSLNIKIFIPVWSWRDQRYLAFNIVFLEKIRCDPLYEPTQGDWPQHLIGFLRALMRMMKDNWTIDDIVHHCFVITKIS